ncbi:MAG: chemotaxis protein CheX [Gemmatimonadota bacterium]
MQFLEGQIVEITQRVWTSMFGVEIRHLEGSRDDPGAERLLTAWVTTMGDWNGALALECSPGLARQAAAAMMDLEIDEASEADSRDVLGELANIIGGNVKALIGSSGLSAPTVAEVVDDEFHFPHCRVVSRVHFHVKDHRFVVKLMKTKPRESETYSLETSAS